MANKDEEKWTMPGWMEPLRNVIVNTGSRTVEEMVNAPGQGRVPEPAEFYLRAGVQAQVRMIERLNSKGLLHNLATANALAEPMGEVELDDTELKRQVSVRIRKLHHQLRMDNKCGAEVLKQIAEIILVGDGYTWGHECNVTGNRYWDSGPNDPQGQHSIRVTPEGWME